MSKLSYILTIFIILAGTLGLSGCVDDDGDWDSMKWKAEQNLDTEKGVYLIPSEGGTFTFVCSNYKPWLVGAEANGIYFSPENDTYDFHHLAGEWFQASIQDHCLTVSFAPNTTSERLVEIVTTAGDIFHTFVFRQR